MKFMYLAIALIAPCNTFGMEVVPVEMVDLEAAQPKEPTHEIGTAIRAGKLSRLNDLLAKKPTRSASALSTDLSNLSTLDQGSLTNALGYTTVQLATETESLAQGYVDNFWARYKTALLPFAVAALATGNLVVTAISVDKQVNAPGNTQSLQSIVLGSDGLTLGQTVITLAAAGSVMGKEIYAGVLDLVQIDKVDKLKNAQLLLQTLQAQAANSTGAAATTEQAAIVSAETAVAVDTVAAQQATTAEQQAAASATTAEEQFDASNAAAVALNNGGVEAVGQQVAQVVEQGANAAGNTTVANAAQKVDQDL